MKNEQKNKECTNKNEGGITQPKALAKVVVFFLELQQQKKRKHSNQTHSIHSFDVKIYGAFMNIKATQGMRLTTA